MTSLCRSYWAKTGAIFMGDDDELSELIMDCGNQHAWTDEEGRFNAFYCMVDWKMCDKCCNKHNPRLDEDWRPFIDSVNQRFKKC